MRPVAIGAAAAGVALLAVSGQDGPLAALGLVLLCAAFVAGAKHIHGAFHE